MTYVAPRRRVSPPAVVQSAAEAVRGLKLLYQGQGTVRFALGTEAPFSVTFSGGESKPVRWAVKGKAAMLIEQDARGDWQTIGKFDLLEGPQARDGYSYWFSVDSHNRALRFGTGEARLGTMAAEHLFPAEPRGSDPYKRLGTIDRVEIDGPLKGQPLILPDPVVVDPPPRVLPHDGVTMEDLARGQVTVPGSLSAICQRLYDAVAGARFELDTPDFPNFSKAIQASILDPDGWCHQKLKEKADFFHSADPTMGYLRITLGTDQGDSPGIPFVLEVWPGGHKSPIHNHAGADAVIRVFHGAVQVRLFSMLSNPMPEPFAVKTFSKGDVTWITAEYNQIHQLENFGEEPCITIQCYMYEEGDKVHQPGFSDLVDGKAESFLPYSDADFLWFKKKMREEWYGVPPAPAKPRS